MEERNRFRGLDLIDKMHDEQWTEVCDNVLETGSKMISKKKNCKKAKWLTEEGLQVAVKRKKQKAKEKRKDTPLNAEFQRLAR